ncbi:leukocyte elastase inhibitor-like isoform X1 [Pomacea canaliculata]|uniref:leukocyte elastase inhibitor-like isoform X1 n=1 Tax=Pomacea canaliculata TaxID=400727 RepID=UPI000D72DF6D|nr:leukocyte elastase inhibitor-like isoform X1 [Pomacea canaliculata]
MSCVTSHPAPRGAYWYSDRQIRSASDIYCEGVTGSIRLQLFSPAIMGVVRVVVAVLLLGVLLHSGCQVASSRDGRHRTRAASLSQSVTSFGASLYRQLTSGNLDNLIFSPFSVFVALTMTLLGAGGVTKRELMTVLSVGPQRGVHQTLQNAIASFQTGLDPGTNLTLRVANAVYYNASQITVLPGFSQNIQRLYAGSLKPFEEQNPEAAINSWVAEVTDGMIQNLLSPGHIADSGTIFMLLNAVFFEGLWKTQFDPEFTSDSDFTTATGTVVQVPMMHKTYVSIRLKNIEALNAQVVELPYRGDRFSLFLVMPNTWDGLLNLERSLNGQMLNNIVSDMPGTVRPALSLPKFRLRTRKTLNEHLQAIGLRSAFSNAANFRRLSRNSVKISQVFQEAVIEVTESGSRAAAVTSIQAVPKMRLRNRVVVNKPFVFILRDKISGLNIFMGRVADPSQQSP